MRSWRSLGSASASSELGRDRSAGVPCAVTGWLTESTLLSLRL